MQGKSVVTWSVGGGNREASRISVTLLSRSRWFLLLGHSTTPVRSARILLTSSPIFRVTTSISGMKTETPLARPWFFAGTAGELDWVLCGENRDNSSEPEFLRFRTSWLESGFSSSSSRPHHWSSNSLSLHACYHGRGAEAHWAGPHEILWVGPGTNLAAETTQRVSDANDHQHCEHVRVVHLPCTPQIGHYHQEDILICEGAPQ